MWFISNFDKSLIVFSKSSPKLDIPSFSQFLSDVVNVGVLRPKVQETTALGAAFMAGLQIGVYKSLKDISQIWHLDRKFSPGMSSKSRNQLLKGWSAAIKKTLTN